MPLLQSIKMITLMKVVLFSVIKWIYWYKKRYFSGKNTLSIIACSVSARASLNQFSAVLNTYQYVWSLNMDTYKMRINTYVH